MSLLVILLILILIGAAFGGWGPQPWGYARWSPLGLILVIVIVLLLMGHIHI